MTPEWESPPEPTLPALASRVLEGAEFEAECSRIERLCGWRPRKIRVRDLRCKDGRVVREWTYI